MRPESTARFWSRVHKTEGCWWWTGYVGPNGYGQTVGPGHDSRDRSAHRVSWRLAHGPIPSGLNVLHRCDHKSCVRPDHLFLGTQADNMQDFAAKGMTTRGELDTEAKLTADDVRAIRALAGTVSQSELGRRYGICQAQVWRIVHRLRWAHI